MAMRGLRPIAEIQLVHYLPLRLSCNMSDDLGLHFITPNRQRAKNQHAAYHSVHAVIALKAFADRLSLSE